jgi:hypothetical protein
MASHREVSLKSLRKKPYAGEVAAESHQQRPVDMTSGYTGFLPGLQNTVAASFPTQTKMSSSYSQDYVSHARQRSNAATPTKAVAAVANGSPTKRLESSDARSTAMAGPTGGYTGFRPGTLDTYGRH